MWAWITHKCRRSWSACRLRIRSVASCLSAACHRSDLDWDVWLTTASGCRLTQWFVSQCQVTSKYTVCLWSSLPIKQIQARGHSQTAVTVLTTARLITKYPILCGPYMASGLIPYQWLKLFMYWIHYSRFGHPSKPDIGETSVHRLSIVNSAVLWSISEPKLSFYSGH